MSIPSHVKVLFFDVFGTCVAQIPPVADELFKATKEALKSNGSSISSEVRTKATEVTHEQWFEFGKEWNSDIDKYTRNSIATTNNVDWVAVDKYRPISLHKLLSEQGLVITDTDHSNSITAPDFNTPPTVKSGSLFTYSEILTISKIWSHLPPWPDTISGLNLLNTKYTTSTLSNTYNALMTTLVHHSSIPFKHVMTSDLFNSYKPSSKVYLGAAEKLGVKPEECALVAAHLSDLKGAKACGFYPIYVERPLEEKSPALRDENIPNLIIKEGEGGFVTLAERLGIRSG